MMHELDALLGYRDPEPTPHEPVSGHFEHDDVSRVHVIARPITAEPLPYWQQALAIVSRWLVVSR